MSPNSLPKDLWLLFQAYYGGAMVGDEASGPPVAVVMGAQVLKGGRASRTLEARVRHAARLYDRGVLDLVIPTGGLGEHPPKEAGLMSDILLSEKVPEKAILPEDTASNTWESAVRVARISRDSGIDRVRIVTDPLHCIRTVWAFEAAGLSAVAEPAYDSPMWRKPGSRSGQLVREAVALVWYRVRYGTKFRRLR
ncbi:MAG: YdcF family protein [Rubrobacteraceae bacterium]